jgi:hypothetical protein
MNCETHKLRRLEILECLPSSRRAVPCRANDVQLLTVDSSSLSSLTGGGSPRPLIPRPIAHRDRLNCWLLHEQKRPVANFTPLKVGPKMGSNTGQEASRKALGEERKQTLPADKTTPPTRIGLNEVEVVAGVCRQTILSVYCSVD